MLNAFTVYPDGPAALIVLTGVWALIRSRRRSDSSGAESAWPWLLARRRAGGAAVAAHAVRAARRQHRRAGVLDLARTRNPAGKASAFLAVPSVSALAWIGFFIAIYGAPDPAIPYRGSDLGSPSYIAGGLGGLFFDQMYGLFVNAPVLIAAPSGMLVLGSRAGPYRRLSAQLAFIALPYVLTVTHFAMWWGGFSSPARFLVPLLPSLAIPAAVAWAALRERSVRDGACGRRWSLTGLPRRRCSRDVDRGRLAYFDRGNVYALWTEWVSRTRRSGARLPAYFARVQRQQPGGLFFVEIAVWLGAIGLESSRVREVERALDRPGRAAPWRRRAGAAMAFAVMIAVTVVWRTRRRGRPVARRRPA